MSEHIRLNPHQEAALYVWHRELAFRLGYRETREVVVHGHPGSCECHYVPDRDYELGGRARVTKLIREL